MRKGYLKGFVLPTVYVLLIVASFFSVAILNNLLIGDISNYDYSQSLMQDVTESVLKENEPNMIVKPYSNPNVSTKVTYYNKEDAAEKQQTSLIVYEDTYIPSTGNIYSSSENFDVLAVYDGEVKNVTTDNILGTVIEIAHNQNLTTYYYSLTNVLLQAGDEIKSGTVLGQATPNIIYDKEPNFLFEVYYQGKSIDPEKFYSMNIDELQ